MVKLSKARTKFIKSLQIKKYRQLEQTFLVEGEKSVLEVLNSDFSIRELLVSDTFATTHGTILQNQPFTITSEADLTSVSSLKSNRSALALVKMRPNESLDLSRGIFIALDDLNDPGNLGTIIRIADWYGISGILASETTAEIYNPKVISASKGSFTRVPIYYTNLTKQLTESSLPVYAADMDGESVYTVELPESMILLMGNESHGISQELQSLIDRTITIPRVGGAESLNVAIATAIICDNFRRG